MVALPPSHSLISLSFVDQGQLYPHLQKQTENIKAPESLGSGPLPWQRAEKGSAVTLALFVKNEINYDKGWKEERLKQVSFKAQLWRRSCMQNGCTEAQISGHSKKQPGSGWGAESLQQMVPWFIMAFNTVFFFNAAGKQTCSKVHALEKIPEGGENESSNYKIASEIHICIEFHVSSPAEMNKRIPKRFLWNMWEQRSQSCISLLLSYVTLPGHLCAFLGLWNASGRSCSRSDVEP